MKRERVWPVQYLLVVVLLAMLIVGNVMATHDVLTAPHPGHNDFLSRWEGARTFWRDGLSPYSEQASLNIQRRIYGRAVYPDEDPGYFAYPFYTVFLVGPLTLLSYAWASAVWMVLLEACLVGAAILLVDLYRWRPGPLMLAWWVFWMLANYYSARGLILGQPGHVVFFLEVLTLWALANQRDRLAGLALAVSTLKPQMGFLIVPFLLLWGVKTRRRSFLLAFGASFGGLMLLSFAFEPAWMSHWFAQLREYTSYTALGAPVWIVMQYYLGLGIVGEWIVNLALWGVLLWAWMTVLVGGRVERTTWVVMLTLTITHLSAIRTATPHFVVFAVPFVFYLKSWTPRIGRSGVFLLLLLLLILPWAHFLLTVEGEFEHPTVYLPVPFSMLFLLWWTRQQWWGRGVLLGGASMGANREIRTGLAR